MNPLRGLYVISDEQRIAADNFENVFEQILRGGARIIQYRDKLSDHTKRKHQAQLLKTLCIQYQALLIINDDIDLALAVNADGVHIGKHDTSLSESRKKLGASKIIGVSCYNDFSLAQAATQHGADYIAFGSFFPSPTKPDAARAHPDLLIRAKQELQIPVCGIGGITLRQAPGLIQSGADMLAVISDVLAAGDIELRCREYSKLFA